MRAFSRAPTEPVDAEGRRYIKRCQDDSALISRVGTWPPRDELADDLSGYDQHWKQVRKSQSKYKNQGEKKEKKENKREKEKKEKKGKGNSGYSTYGDGTSGYMYGVSTSGHRRSSSAYGGSPYGYTYREGHSGGRSYGESTDSYGGYTYGTSVSGGSL